MFEHDAAQADLVMAPPSQRSTRPHGDPITASIGQDPVRDFGGAARKIGVQADTAEQAVVRIDDREVSGLFAEPHHVAIPDPHACVGDRVDLSGVPVPDVRVGECLDHSVDITEVKRAGHQLVVDRDRGLRNRRHRSRRDRGVDRLEHPCNLVSPSADLVRISGQVTRADR